MGAQTWRYDDINPGASFIEHPEYGADGTPYGLDDFGVSPTLADGKMFKFLKGQI